MNYQFKEGDEFKFKPIQTKNKRFKCTYPNKTFLIDSVSSLGTIYYLDTRTNIKCKCVNCNTPLYRFYDSQTSQWITKDYIKQTSNINIILYKSKNQRIRDIKFKLLDI